MGRFTKKGLGRAFSKKKPSLRKGLGVTGHSKSKDAKKRQEKQARENRQAQQRGPFSHPAGMFELESDNGFQKTLFTVFKRNCAYKPASVANGGSFSLEPSKILLGTSRNAIRQWLETNGALGISVGEFDESGSAHLQDEYSQRPQDAPTSQHVYVKAYTTKLSKEGGGVYLNPLAEATLALASNAVAPTPASAIQDVAGAAGATVQAVVDAKENVFAGAGGASARLKQGSSLSQCESVMALKFSFIEGEQVCSGDVTFGELLQNQVFTTILGRLR